jgi:hypothetical protein
MATFDKSQASMTPDKLVPPVPAETPATPAVPAATPASSASASMSDEHARQLQLAQMQARAEYRRAIPLSSGTTTSTVTNPTL